MARNWNLRQLFAEKKNKTAERETAEQSVSLTGMIESGDFKIDLAARTVTLRSQNLSLTAEEFDVLVFLAGHPQRMVTPHTMLTTSWTANRLRQTEFLRVLMSLRKKTRCCRTRQTLSQDRAVDYLSLRSHLFCGLSATNRRCFPVEERSRLYDFFMNFLDELYAVSFPIRAAGCDGRKARCA